MLSERPDLVLMDIRMPGSFDGLDATCRILAEHHVCIVRLTALSNEEYRQRATALQASGYVVTPVTHKCLVPRLEEAFRKFAQQ